MVCTRCGYVGADARPDSPPETRAPSRRQLVEQGLGLRQVMCIEAVGKPAVDRGEKIVGLQPFALTAPESATLLGEFCGKL
jgi:hypothetical protein